MCGYRAQLVMAAVVAAACAPSTGWAVVLYRETFSTTATSDPSPAAADWAVHSGAATGTYRPGNGTTTHSNINATSGLSFMGVSAANSRPYDLFNTPSAGPPTSYLFDTNGDTVLDSNPRGLLYISGTAWGATSAERRALVWTPEFSFDPAAYPGLKFSWYQGDANPLDTLALAIRIGAQWYVSTTAFTTAQKALADFAGSAEFKELTYSNASANWQLLTFNGTFDPVTDVGGNSSVGLVPGGTPAGATLPAGNITAFGLYSHDPQTSGAGNRRFDTFTIETTTPLIPGDTDGDGVVELEDDLNPIRDHFRLSVTMRSQGDLTGDGFVDLLDFREWKVAYLGGGGSLAGVDLRFLSVPEPPALSIAAASVFGVAVFSGRRRCESAPSVVRQSIIGAAGVDRGLVDPSNRDRAKAGLG